MMYNEFLEIANVTESEITAKTYDEVIEPMYNAANLNKVDFVKMLNIDSIINNFSSPRNVANKIVNEMHNMLNMLGHVTVDEDKFSNLAKEYCELKGYTYCYNSNPVYETIDKRGCSVNTGFVAKVGSRYVNFAVVNDNLMLVGWEKAVLNGFISTKRI